MSMARQSAPRAGGLGKAEKATWQGLPAVPAPAAGGESAMQGSDGATGMQSVGESCERHPLDDFNDLLQAFDGVMGVCHQRDQRRRQGFCNEAIDDSARLPRICNQSSSELAVEAWLSKLSRPRSKRRRKSHDRIPPGPSPVSFNPALPVERDFEWRCRPDEDPLDLMLRSKGQTRRGLEGLQVHTGYATEPDDDGFDTNNGKLAANFDGAVAGVFRLTHAETGFVHYGYSWDIAGAKADQLRRLKIKCDTGTSSISGAHPHRGLSAVVRGQLEQHGFGVQPGYSTKNRSTINSLRDAGMPNIRFEVVRLVPLPARFRAIDFEKKMAEACAREVVDRRSHLLVLAARQYKTKHVGPAFRRIFANYERAKSDEQCAAAVEVQRVWRGQHARYLVRREREAEILDRLEIERARAGAVLAAWAQAKHRGDVGRRRANERRGERAAEMAARMKQESITAATTIQQWVRSVYHERKTAAAAAEKASVDAILHAMRLEEETKEPLSSGMPLRGPPRPISASEARVAIDPSDVDTKASLSVASYESSFSSPQRRPSSSREFRPRSITHSQDDTSDAPGARQDPIRRKQRERKRPSSAPRSNHVGDVRPREDVVELITAGDFVPDTLPDASRLVLEGNPDFTAATAIQAAWRGFMTRLGARKRRRAAAALRRKREGKWRKQRGVVGKRVSVAWDERKDFEGGRGDGDGGVAACIEIQVLRQGGAGR